MKNLFYCTKIDKNGNKLTSSYTTKKGADKYGGGCTVEEKVYRADFSDPNAMRIGDEGLLLRGILRNSNPPEPSSRGQFTIWAKRDGVWAETVFSFPSYSAANSAMKAMIQEYEAMAITDSEDGAEVADEPRETSTTEIDMVL